MPEQKGPLPIVDGLQLPEEMRAVFCPGEEVAGAPAPLPRWFFEVTSREAAELEIAPCFRVREFLLTDVHEAHELHRYPRYIPCSVTVLAAAMAVLRQKWGTYVHVAANGGYRSPSHARGSQQSTHRWGTAADIYRVGGRYLDTRDAIEEAAADVRAALPTVHVKPFGYGAGETDDHLHIDLGYVEVVPNAGRIYER